MKKALGFIFLIIFGIMLYGCKRVDYVVGKESKIEENEYFNHYDFTSFRGDYSFTKEITSLTTVRIVTYCLDSDSEMIIKITNNDNTIYEYNVNKENSDTNYLELEKGSYTFTISSSEIVKAEILFNWKDRD